MHRWQHISRPADPQFFLSVFFPCAGADPNPPGRPAPPPAGTLHPHLVNPPADPQGQTPPIELPYCQATYPIPPENLSIPPAGNQPRGMSPRQTCTTPDGEPAKGSAPPIELPYCQATYPIPPADPQSPRRGTSQGECPPGRPAPPPEGNPAPAPPATPPSSIPPAGHPTRSAPQ